MRDEKEERKKQARSNKQQDKATCMHSTPKCTCTCVCLCVVFFLLHTYTCVQVEFFGDDAPVKEGKDGVMIVRYTDGRASGDALVLFENRDLENAMAKNRQCMGSRYVELYSSTMQEFQMV